MKIHGLNALSDNYIWIIEANHQAWVVDPGESQPVIDYLNEHKLTLTGILLTHHHYDHTDGVEALLKLANQIPVYASAKMQKPYVTHRLHEGDQIQIGAKHLNVIETPGHTLDHICFYNNTVLFSGDTLFAAGCGRVFEGTAKQMSDSLIKIRQLADNLLVYCGHEYTLTNLNFARRVEPENPSIQARYLAVKRLTLAHKPCVPSKLEEEKATNPFLRFDQMPLSGTITQHKNQGKPIAEAHRLFALLRAWKDELDRSGELEERI